jgi:hypothetical protein
MTTRTDFSEKMKKDGNSAPIADRSRNGSGMLPRSPRSIDGAGATKKVLYTQQMVGPIPKSAIVNRETVKIYMDVSYDGEYHVKDSILIQFQPK